MKKALSVLLCVLLVFGFALSALAAANGDYDADGSFSAADARMILRAAVNLEHPDEEKTLLSDLDMDGKITSSDARTALRLSVGLDISSKTLCANEYEVLLSGVFLTDVQIKMGKSAYSFRMAAGPASTYLEMSIEDLVYLMLVGEGAADPAAVKAKLEPALEEIDQNQQFGMLFNNKGFYLIDPAKKCYASLSDLMGDAGDDLGGFADGLFEGLPQLSEAETVTNTTFGGKLCKAYTFPQADGSMKILMDGKKLAGIVNYDTKGAEIMTFVFSRVSLAVPAEYTAITSAFVKEGSSKESTSQTLNDVFMTMFALAMLAA